MTRMQSRDLDQVALVALLQREAGGNAAEVLDQVVGQHPGAPGAAPAVSTLTAQGRMARWIVRSAGRLFLAIYLINRDYLRRSGTRPSRQSSA